MRLPVVARFSPSVSEEADRRVDALAAGLLEKHPRLRLPAHFEGLELTQEQGEGPTVHLDDLGEIALIDRRWDVGFQEHRARLRAGGGDLVVSCAPVDSDHETYCRDQLGLGRAHWLVPETCENPQEVAACAWRDRSVRRELVQTSRDSPVLYLHPHMGTHAVWALAYLIADRSRREVRMVAPPPGVCRFVNHKGLFAQTVEALFGREWLPRTYAAWNLSMLAHHVRRLAEIGPLLVLKLPDAAGGSGNCVIESRRFRDRTLSEIRSDLATIVPDLHWVGRRTLLVSCWETDVLQAPSAQTWIPPRAVGPPVVEALYNQLIEGDRGYFVGGQPAVLSSAHERQIVDRCWLLASLFQRLGYVGRCSFDLLMVGRERSAARLELIECNGRWGGISSPMMLLNRLFGDALSQPHAIREASVEGLNDFTFAEVLRHLGRDVWDRRSGRGHLILFNPGRIRAASGINVIALGDDWSEALERAEQVSERLVELVAGRPQGA